MTRLLRYLLLVPIFVLTIGDSVPAQGGENFRKPKQEAGLGMNVPSGNRYAKIRSEAALDFRNESPLRTARRVLDGSPLLSWMPVGTRLRTAADDFGTVCVLLHERDGADRVSLQLPRGFLGGVILIEPDGGGHLLLPLTTETFQIDVPLFLRAASATGSGTLTLTFYAIRNSMVELIRLEAIVDQDRRTVAIRY